jgi:hypothetical protein
MNPLNWKVAIAGGALVGFGVGGFVAALNDDPALPLPDQVRLRQASAGIRGLSAPVVVPQATPAALSAAPTTTVAPAPAARGQGETDDRAERRQRRAERAERQARAAARQRADSPDSPAPPAPAAGADSPDSPAAPPPPPPAPADSPDSPASPPPPASGSESGGGGSDS